MSFQKVQASFPSNFASICSAIKNNSSVLFLAQTLYTLVKSSPLKCKFFRFSSARVKIIKFFLSILNRQVKFSSIFASFSIFMTHNSSVNCKLIHFLFLIKGPNKSPTFQTFKCALVKICKIPHVIFGSTGHFSFKFGINLDFHQT